MRLFASLVTKSLASIFLLGANMAIIAIGIYSFSQSIVWAVVGGFLGDKLLPLSTPIYIALEYYFTGGLTIFSALLVGITIAQFMYAHWLRKNQHT